MLSYQHGYHAGNFADVLKHAVLLALLAALHKKDKRYSVIDLHAGDGVYDLSSVEAQKTGEYRDGIGRLFAVDDAPVLVRRYLDAVRSIQPGDGLSRYYGSSAWVAERLREQDQAFFAEAHPQVFAALSSHFPDADNRELFHGDGFELLDARFSQLQGRGLAIIDPSYETSEDFSNTSRAWAALHKHWRNAMHLLWYPLLAHKPVALWRDRLLQTAGSECLRIELSVMASDASGMTGSGLLLRNPPWGLQEELEEALPYLAELLSQGEPSWVLHLQDSA